MPGKCCGPLPWWLVGTELLQQGVGGKDLGLCEERTFLSKREESKPAAGSWYEQSAQVKLIRYVGV